MSIGYVIKGCKVNMDHTRQTCVWRALANGEPAIEAVRGVSATLQTAEVIMVHHIQDSCYTPMIQMTNMRFQ